MASRVPKFSVEELQRAMSGPSIGQALSTGFGQFQEGESLARTIEEKKLEKQKKLLEIQQQIAKIKAEKEQGEREQRFADTLQGPVVARPGGQEIRAAETRSLAPEYAPTGTLAKAFPKEVGEAMLKQKLQEESEAGKLERAMLRDKQQNERPDNVKSVFEIQGKPYVLKYSGKVEPLNISGKAEPFVKPTIPAAEAEQFGDFDTLSTQLEKVKQSKKPSFTGFVQGPVGKGLQRIGVGASKERANFLANINSIRNQLIYLRSGKQINEKEYERLLAELPNENASDVDFDAKLQNFETVFNEVKGNRRAAFQSGFSGIPEETSTQTPNQSSSAFRVIGRRPSR